MRDWSNAALETASSGLESAGVLCLFATLALGFVAVVLLAETERVKLAVAAAVFAALSAVGVAASWTAEVYVRELIEEREVTP